jgi:integrase
MPFRIKSFIASNGERFSQIYAIQEPGFPLFYPTAYLVRSLRLNATHETQKVHLEAIKRVCEWEAQNKIDLTVRFQHRKFLLPSEIDDLAGHLRAARTGKPGQTISVYKGNTFICYAADYLRWLANEVITDADNPAISQMIKTQNTRLREKLISRMGSKSATDQKILGKHLSEKSREQLWELFSDPFIEVFRVKDRGSRLRTIVMLWILYATGMRRGELLALRIKDFLESTGGEVARLVIERNHNDSYDTRLNQPVVKTLGRVVPITPELERLLWEYITNYRATVPSVGFEAEDYIFVTHRKGRGQGKPLSISNFDQAVTGLKKLFPALGKLHPHLLRHDWNFRFSQLADKQKINPVKERALRETLMGWMNGSDMGRRYNQRHIQEQSLNIGLDVAGDTQRRSATSTDTLTEASKLALVVATVN